MIHLQIVSCVTTSLGDGIGPWTEIIGFCADYRQGCLIRTRNSQLGAHVSITIHCQVHGGTNDTTAVSVDLCPNG